MARRADKLREELAALDQEVGSTPVPGRQMHKVLPLAIAFVALFCFGGLTWYAYNQGILEGSFKYYWENGNVRVSGKFKNQKRTGRWKNYNKKGEVIAVNTLGNSTENLFFSVFLNH